MDQQGGAAATLRTLFDLSGQTALVTGGSRGLGLQMAEALGEFGARVIVTARKQNELDEAVAHLKALGVDAQAIASDLGRPNAPAQLIETIAAAGGRVDILVNNAALAWGAPADSMPLEAWDKQVALNLTAPFLLCQEVAKRWMIPAGRGRIVNIASIEGLFGRHPRMGGVIGYHATKGGLINFTRGLAAEWGKHNISVNAIAPGYFPSKMTSLVLDQFERDIVDDTPLGKLGGDSDLKGAVLLFASGAASHITGQVLAVDGGASAI